MKIDLDDDILRAFLAEPDTYEDDIKEVMEVCRAMVDEMSALWTSAPPVMEKAPAEEPGQTATDVEFYRSLWDRTFAIAASYLARLENNKVETEPTGSALPPSPEANKEPGDNESGRESP